MEAQFVITQIYDGFGIPMLAGRNFHGDRTDLKFNNNVASAWHYSSYIEAEDAILDITVEGIFKIDRIFVNLIDSVSYKLKRQ